ncbi:hypothetical protein TRICI_001787 [Trichomonascus ciferrii]|uniref:Calcium channel YVC1-like C-terminal transmembrane domain-containing protein n=1 Tax=Trichomonascus ciferrii TaxID=44093 RepID=A0A642VCE5_9ASCO|nr:hypothetical protein TRICI_001787 [Trichomonascus ciferrii]
MDFELDLQSDLEISEFETGFNSGKQVGFPALPEDMDFEDVVYAIELTLASAIDAPYSYKQLSASSLSAGLIRPLVRSLVEPKGGVDYRFEMQHRGIVAGLIIARCDFLSNTSDIDMATGYMEKGISDARAYAAEIIATRFLYHVPIDSDRIEFITYECKPEKNDNATTQPSSESSPLLNMPRVSPESQQDVYRKGLINMDYYYNFSALQIAVISEAKRFLCSGPVESVLNRLWNGKIVFWDGISREATKSAHIYPLGTARRINNSNSTEPNLFCFWKKNDALESKNHDIYARLRVPKYRSFFIMINYAILLGLFYLLLFTESDDLGITMIEVLLHVWFAGFATDEFMQAREAVSLGHYTIDYWSVFDITIVLIYLVFFCLRTYSYLRNDYILNSLSFDILSLEALLLVPRFFSFLSIFPYFGTILPCLKELTKEFVKFLTLIIIIYLGFFTTFSFLGRDVFTISKMFWMLVEVFFGAASSGFAAAPQISEEFGPVLMLIFVTLTNILLITVLVSILSQRFSVMMLNAREEYVMFFAATVLESMTTVERLTYFYPPLNLIGLVMRPLRLILDHNQYRQLRILVLKLTHWPFAVGVYIYESLQTLHHQNRQHKLNLRRNSRSIPNLPSTTVSSNRRKRYVF